MKKVTLLLLPILLLFSKNVSAQTYSLGDINANALITANHDSTQCATMANEMYFITISNSFLGDSVVMKDQNSGQIMAWAINSTGANPWITTLNPMSIIPFFPDDQLYNNVAFFGGMPMKIISGPDTILNVSSNFIFTVPNPCLYDTVSGKIYIDHNNDCSFNGTDVPLNAVPAQSTVALSTGGYTTNNYANALGNYTAKLQKSWMTSYTVSIPSPYQFIFPATSCSPFSYTSSTLPQSNYDFSLQCTSNVDVQASAGHPSNARPLQAFFIHPYVSNTGCDTVSGILTLIKDAKVTYNASMSANPATYVNGDTLRWTYTQLTNVSNGAYWNSFFAGVHLTPISTANIGDTLCFSISTTVAGADVNVANNQYAFCMPIINSYDPNIKEVSPKGLGATGDIPPTTSNLNYTIHFQNTGTAPAYNIYIIDTLDADVDASSLKIEGTSHNMTPSWLTPNVVKFYFYNINLPDSVSNEPKSHGQLSYNIKLKSGLPLGAQIKNTAHIYFDNNPAIVTNTTFNTIVNPTIITNTDKNIPFAMYPNPANDYLHIAFANNNVHEISIFATNSQLILHQQLSMPNSKIDISKLQAGIYFIQIKEGANVVMKKFVKE